MYLCFRFNFGYFFIYSPNLEYFLFRLVFLVHFRIFFVSCKLLIDLLLYSFLFYENQNIQPILGHFHYLVRLFISLYINIFPITLIICSLINYSLHYRRFSRFYRNIPKLFGRLWYIVVLN
jgi:hypothetical protein